MYWYNKNFKNLIGTSSRRYLHKNESRINSSFDSSAAAKIRARTVLTIYASDSNSFSLINLNAGMATSSRQH